MKLSPGERLIAVMLADLMEHFKVDGEIDPKDVKTLLTGNDEWAFAMKYGGIFNDEERSQADIDETADILDMWRLITFSVQDLSGQEMEGLDLDQFRFEGFDANHDPHYHIARTLIEDLGRWQELAPMVNSHTQSSLPRHRAMLTRFRQAREAKGGRPHFSLAELKDIVGYREPAVSG